ncbi:MAG: (Fe-S)-binding protein [bacterium]|nr:(Fe-S)-binding protein [bacterium]
MSETGLRNELEDLLRRCVECGLCLPHCATWLATGNEVQSPRGRLLLLGDVLDQASPDPAALSALDQCIGCRACEEACPSGVPFSLLERGQQRAAAAAPEPALPGPVLRRLDRPGFLAALRPLANTGQDMLAHLAGRTWRDRLARIAAVQVLGTVPRGPGSDQSLVALLDRLTGNSGPWQAPRPAPEPDAGPLGFFAGCANRGLLPDTSRRLRGLLEAAGFQITVPGNQDCCGALAAHTGRPGRAARLRRRNRRAFAGAGRIVVEAAGCGLELQSRADGPEAEAVDAVVVLAGADLPPLATLGLAVAVHDPCHARHGQGIVDEPRDLLRSIPGVRVLEPDEAEVCCGAGGAWGLRYPHLSEELGRRKARLLAATGADLIVTSNPGCLGRIADGLARESVEPPILPLTDLLWYAAIRAKG